MLVYAKSGPGLYDSYYKADAYQKTITKVVVSEGIESIDKSFTCSEAMETIILPSSLSEVSENTFKNCSSLKNIYLRGSEGSVDLSDTDYGNSVTLTWDYTGE